MSYLIFRPDGLYLNKWDQDFGDYETKSIDGWNILGVLDHSIQLEYDPTIGDLLQYLSCLPENVKTILEQIFNVPFHKVSDKLLSDDNENSDFAYVGITDAGILFNNDKNVPNNYMRSLDLAAFKHNDTSNWAVSSLKFSDLKLLPMKIVDTGTLYILNDQYTENAKFTFKPMVTLKDFLKLILIELSVYDSESEEVAA